MGTREERWALETGALPQTDEGQDSDISGIFTRISREPAKWHREYFPIGFPNVPGHFSRNLLISPRGNQPNP